MTGDDKAANGASGSDDADRRRREDAVWQSIIENYGDRPELKAPPPAPPDPPADPFPSLSSRPPAFEMPAELGPRAWTPGEDPDDDGYVPPPPPPLPRPQGLRLAAWLGLFGVPAVVLVCIVLGVSLPSPLGFLALVWFVGGFGYLVATMNGPRDPGGGGDDGAVV